MPFQIRLQDRQPQRPTKLVAVLADSIYDPAAKDELVREGVARMRRGEKPPTLTDELTRVLDAMPDCALVVFDACPLGLEGGVGRRAVAVVVRRVGPAGGAAQRGRAGSGTKNAADPSRRSGCEN